MWFMVLLQEAEIVASVSLAMLELEGEYNGFQDYFRD